jgi:hypothetical protein
MSTGVTNHGQLPSHGDFTSLVPGQLYTPPGSALGVVYLVGEDGRSLLPVGQVTATAGETTTP